MYRMSKTPKRTIISRIDQRLKALAPPGKRVLNDRAASLRCGLSQDGIRTLRRQMASGRQTSVRIDTVEKLANGLLTTPQWLLREEGPETIIEPGHIDSEEILDEEVHVQTVPVAGHVSAGAAMFLPLPAGELDRVPAPTGASDFTQCLESRGKSLGQMFDRWLIFYDDIRSPVTTDLIGKLCVVGLEDGRVVVKMVAREKGRYVLLSNSEQEPPIRDVTITWAAKVIDMRPQ